MLEYFPYQGGYTLINMIINTLDAHNRGVGFPIREEGGLGNWRRELNAKNLGPCGIQLRARILHLRKLSTWVE